MAISEGGAILLIDDDADALTILANAIERQGYRTFLARSAEEGLAIIAEDYQRLDCVVLDIMMPGGRDGYAVMQAVKSDPRTVDLPILVLSAHNSPQDVARSIGEGAFQHLAKPCDVTHLCAIVKNIVRLRELERRSLSDARKYQAIIDNSPVQIAVVSPELRIMEMNREFRDAFPEVRIGDNILETCFPLLIDSADHPVRRALRSGAVENGKLSLSMNDQPKHLDIRAAPIRDAKGAVVAIIYICVDATEQIEMENRLLRQVERYNRVLQEQDRTTDHLIQAQRELQQKGAELERLSLTDALTGLHNRRQFDLGLETECRRAGRYHHPLTLLMIDIDHFKKVNDEHGHPVGDLVLRELARIFTNALRETDSVCRYGGEEFAIILPETDSATALPIAERLRQTVEAHDFNTPRGGVLSLTISIGCASIHKQVINPSRLLDRADKCLYSAKHKGRNLVVSVDIK